MDPKIPSYLKRYIRKVREGKREKKITQKQQQTSKQNQVVIINQEPSKRKSKPRKRKANESSGKDDYPRIVYIPTSAPNMSIATNNPQNIRQPIPQPIPQFQQVPIYRNPLREEAVRNQFNQPPQFASNQVEQNLPFVAPPPPPPVMSNIVQQPNYIDFLSVSSNPQPISIFSGLSSLTSDGFVEFQEVNQLNERRRREEVAFNEFGGNDAQSISSLGSTPYPSSFMSSPSQSSSFGDIQIFPYNPPSIFSEVQEQNIFVPPPPSPNPILPDIVEQPNSVVSLSEPYSPPLISSVSSNAGFVEHAEVNQLNNQVSMEQRAYNDFGGMNALLEAARILERADIINEQEALMKEEEKQMRRAKNINAGEFYERLMRSSESEREDESVRGGGGGGESVRRGRPQSQLTQQDLQLISDYTEIRYGIAPKNRTEEQKRIFIEGQKLFISRSRTHPEAIEIKNLVKERVLKEKEQKMKKK